MAARSFLYGGGDSSGFNSVQPSSSNKRVSCSSSSSKPPDSFFVSGSSSHFGGSRSMVSFEDNRNGSNGSFFRTFDHEENGDADEYDDYFQQHPEKKRRLKADQVLFLEKSFETENKLEPERKIQLAKDLGLQPRQIAIWFQNRRARWKTKQLEKDYDVLQESYNLLKANYDNLLQEKETLKSQVLDLSDKLLVQQTEKGTCEYSSSTKTPSQPLQQEPVADCVNDEHVSNEAYVQDIVSESSSQKCVEGPISIGDSSHLFEHDQSDESFDEEDHNLEKMFAIPVGGYMLPKIENDEYPKLDGVNSSYLGFHCHGHSDHDQDQSFGFWSLLS